MAATDPGPLLPVLAGEDPIGAGAASSPSDYCPADQQVGGAVEGIWLTDWEDFSLGIHVQSNADQGGCKVLSSLPQENTF